jgi:hypothetical protein
MTEVQSRLSATLADRYRIERELGAGGMATGGGGQPVWAREGNRLLYRVDRAMMAAELAVRDGAVRVAGRRMLFEGDWFRADTGAVASVYDVSPDGQYFLMGRALPGSRAEIVVWTNWLKELDARLGRL